MGSGPADPPPAIPRGPLRRMTREPLLHFALLAGVLFGLHAAFSPASRPVIAVDGGLVDTLLRERATLTGRAQTDADRREVIETVIAEEVLLREARVRGLDSTPRVRAVLVQAARAAIAAEVPPPTEADLRALYETAPDLYARPAMVSLTQVFVPAGDDPPERLLDLLNGGADPKARGAMDPQAGTILRRVAATELARAFDAEMAEAVMGIADGAWHGPLNSPRGRHFIRIDERWPRVVPGFDALRPHLAEAWTLQRRQEALTRKVAELTAGFTVVGP